MVVLFLSCVVCVRLGMAAGIDGARFMKVARLWTEKGNGTALEDLEKLLEEANGGLEEKIRSLFFLWRGDWKKEWRGGKRQNGEPGLALQADRESGGKLLNFVLVSSKVCLFLEGRQCCDEVS